MVRQAGFLLIVSAMVLFSGQQAVLAQGGGPSANEVNAIAKNLYCPVCENVPLDTCPTLACQRWREQIAEKLSLGWSEDEIYDFFVLQYGDRVLAAPPLSGLNWLVYVLPPLLILWAGVALYRNMSDWQNKPTVAIASQKGKAKSGYVKQLEDELERRK